MTTKEKILKEAEKQFIEKGIAGTQIKEIAESVGISRRTMYRYYSSKDELAFVIELIVLEQLNTYFDNITKDLDSNKNALEQLEDFVDRTNLSVISEQIRFTAEFDRYFQDEYPSEILEKDLIRAMDPTKDRLFAIINQGRTEGTIRHDYSNMEIYQFVNQVFLALFQRLELRSKHLKYEYCADIDFKDMFKTIILQGVRAK